LAVCIAYGQVESVRALLCASHGAQGQIEWHPLYGSGDVFSTPAHFCLALPPLGLPSDRVLVDDLRIGAPQIRCLEVLPRGGDADVDARDSRGDTPILWLAEFGSSYDDEEETCARTSGVFGNDGFTPLMAAAIRNNVRLTRFLIQ
jgi:ankyrin repeat protein